MSLIVWLGKVFGYAALGAFMIWLLHLYFHFEWLKNLINSWFNS